jgi:hypothetical protein
VFLLHILQVSESILGPEADYSDYNSRLRLPFQAWEWLGKLREPHLVQSMSVQKFETRITPIQVRSILIWACLLGSKIVTSTSEFMWAPAKNVSDLLPHVNSRIRKLTAELMILLTEADNNFKNRRKDTSITHTFWQNLTEHSPLMFWNKYYSGYWN